MIYYDIYMIYDISLRKVKTKEVPKTEESRLRWDDHTNPLDSKEEPPPKIRIAGWHSHAENNPNSTKE